MMSQGLAVWLVLGLAFCAANLPFLSRRLFGVLPAVGGAKTLTWRLLELVILYFAVGGIALLLEQRAGQVARQGWEFYVVTGALFLTFAFPGFVFRYLLRHRG